ncbi:MAG: sigma-70 family RNA polymerase sigma factor, partial [Verrucomicrobia bacterium]
MTSDGELLRRYTETTSEEAFGELVRRHLDLVYSAALRQVNGDAHLAHDIAQSVFADLARKAVSLANRPALAGWLYTSTHYAAAKAVRTEQRRHNREQEAHAMQELLHDPGPNLDWDKLRPLLDAAMHELSEADREVILMRYFENRQHGEIGEQIGLGENAARMRVERALEKLRTVLSHRGVTTTVALSATLSANAVTLAPTGLATAITTASVLAGTTAVTAATTATAAKTIAMTTLQKTLLAATLTAAVGTGIFEAHQASTLRTQVQTLRQQQAPLTEQIKQLKQERDDATTRQAALEQENERLQQAVAEVPKLRGQVAQLRTAQQSANGKSTGLDPNDPGTQSFLAAKAKAEQITRYLEQMPDKRIPELQFLSDVDWLQASKEAKFGTDAEIRKTLSYLRSLAKNKMPMGWALGGYLRAHDGELPTDLSQLKPYFKTPADDGSTSHWRGVDPARDDAVLDAILARYKLVQTGNSRDLDPKAWLVVEKAPVDKDYDTRLKF